MTPREFAEAIFRMHEILQSIIPVGSAVPPCNGQCKGIAEDNYLNLCPDCYEALMEQLQALQDSVVGKEFSLLLDKRKEAPQNDNGELAGVLAIFKEGSKVTH